MDIDQFVTWWRARERADIERMIGALAAARDTAGGEIGHLRAVAEVRALLRGAGRGRRGCRAAHRARTAALAACDRTGVLAVDRTGAIQLARAAGEAGRSLVVGTGFAAAEELFRPFVAELTFSGLSSAA